MKMAWATLVVALAAFFAPLPEADRPAQARAVAAKQGEAHAAMVPAGLAPAGPALSVPPGEAPDRGLAWLAAAAIFGIIVLRRTQGG